MIQDYLDFAPFVVPGFEANPKGILILYHALYPLVAAKQAMSGGEAPDRRTFSGCLNDELAQGPNRKKRTGMYLNVKGETMLFCCRNPSIRVTVWEPASSKLSQTGIHLTVHSYCVR